MFEITYSRDGVIRARFTVPAVAAGVVGVYRDGVPYRPDGAAICAALPYHYRGAFERAALWLGRNSDGCNVFRADLWDSRRKRPLGSVFARPVLDSGP